ncbi:endonuclease VIII [Alistipes indistinctus]|jgi:DNA-formamidopyrimidine glycosylase|uniref:endonuclease VIII n=1 Tax=Alistipes indistinctus TaxID=626932 RepID=UPI0015F1CD94|nr:endonuclease VIII [Alistipes indistinctus]BCG54616.1 formamidopyrimidine-DNA glycosylase [Alistipes indistinctus]
MIEAPEAVCLSRQLNDAVCGKYISEVVVFHSPHKFTFISPGIDYEGVLLGKRVGKARARGGMVELAVGERALLFSDGANLTYLEPGADLPDKHQLLIGFGDESCLVVSVRMYGGVWCFSQGEFPGPLEPYYRSAKEKPQVLSDAFDLSYFMSLLDEPSAQKKSAKAFLATGQTIPGLGNGVLQDILYRAGMHPKTKISGLTRQQKERLFRSVRETLREMLRLGGRDSETDLFGRPGGYRPRLSKNTAGEPCPRCGSLICKENYLGGSIYYCPGCQPR